MGPFWHRSDYPPLPDEARFRQAVGPMAIPPGDYMVPRGAGMEAMKDEAFLAKLREGPRMILTVMPNTADVGFGRALALWFVYLLVASLFAAYVTSRALPPGADYLRVFQIAGATSFMALGIGQWQNTIWYQRAPSLAFKDTIDALLYALAMAGVFGWLWPQ